MPHGDKLNALVPKKYALEAYDISSYKNSAFSEITLKTDDGTVTEKESGDGPVDASFKAINNIVGKDFVLSDFSLHSVTEGEDALGEAIVKLDLDGRTVSAAAFRPTCWKRQSSLTSTQSINYLTTNENRGS